MADRQSNTPATPSLGADAVFLAMGLAGLLSLPIVFATVVAHAPPLVKVLGVAWFALGLAAPRIFLISLALLMPLFGNQPGGLGPSGEPFPTYLPELGLMGFIVRDLALRVAGRRRVRPLAINGLVRLFVLGSAITLFAQHLHIYCEAVTRGTGFFYGIYTHYQTAPVYGAKTMLDLLLGASLFAALRDAPPPPAWRRRFWLALAAGLLFASVAGLADYFGLASLEFWRGQNPEILVFGYHRLQSFFWHSGWFAEYLAAAGPIVMVGALCGGLQLRNAGPNAENAAPGGLTPTGAIHRARYWWIAVAVLGITQLFTYQRGGWISLSAGLGVVFLMWLADEAPGRRGKALKAMAGAGVIALATVALSALAIPALRDRLKHIVSASDRLLIWRSAIGLGQTHPNSGVGIGNYAFQYKGFYQPDHPYYLLETGTAHNTILHVFAERGWILATIYVAIIASAIHLIWRSWRKEIAIIKQVESTNNPSSADAAVIVRGESMLMMGAIIALVVYGVVQYVHFIRVVDLIFWIVLGTAAGQVAIPNAVDATAGSSRRRYMSWAWCIAGILIAGVLGRDMSRFNQQWLMYAPDGRNFIPAGKEARIDLPPEGTQFSIPVFASYPNEDHYPVTFEFEFGGAQLGVEQFEKPGTRDVVIKLPDLRTPDEPLVIRSSHAWRPYGYRNRDVPILEAGVCYREPIALE